MKNNSLKLVMLFFWTTTLSMPTTSFAEEEIDAYDDNSAADQAPIPMPSLNLGIGISTTTMKQLCMNASSKGSGTTSGVNIGNKSNINISGGNLIEGPAVYNISMQKICNQWQQGSSSASAQAGGGGLIPGL